MNRIASLLFCSLIATTACAQLFSLRTCREAGSQRFAMEFLDRYFVDVLTQREISIERRMQDDKVYFRRGSINDLRDVTDTVPYRIILYEASPSHYEVTWHHQEGEEPFVDLVFPAQYDLLLGIDQVQAQQQLRDVVLCAEPTRYQRQPTAFSPLASTSGNRQTDNIFISQNDTFYTASMTDATYYYNKERPVFDDRHPDLSAANLFAGLINNADYELQIKQSVYGFNSIDYTLRLSQWLNYCAEWGLKTFFGIERQDDDTLLALIIAHSSELGFNHLLSVTLPPGFVSDHEAPLLVRLTPYIPTNNVTNLFQQQSPNHRRIHWQ